MSDSDYLIQTKNLVKKFDDLTAVEDLNLNIRGDEIFGLLGPNGAGKTTSIRMMVGLIVPTSGKVFIRGEEGNHEKDDVGICPQDIVIWNELTTYENIYFMGKMYDVPTARLDDWVEELIEALGLADKKNVLASELSGGMKRKLNFGMSLVHDPNIVVLDEPSAGLDPQSRYSLWEYIRSLRDERGKCVILTTHLMEEADRLSDRVGIMDHGKLLVVDTPENLKRSVGEGDTITIELTDPEGNERALDEIRPLDGVLEVSEVDEKLVIRALDAVGKTARFMGKIEEAGCGISDVSISKTNTLEDVFVHLTGRGFER